jgi:hypothetical protein
LHNSAADLIADVSLLRHYEESQEWAKNMVIGNLKKIVAAATFFGVTTSNVKDEKEDFIKWFNEND